MYNAESTENIGEYTKNTGVENAESTENTGVDPTKNTGVGSNNTEASKITGVGRNDTINDGTRPLTVHEQFQEAERMGAREAASKHENGPTTLSRRWLEHYANLLIETTFDDMETEAVFEFMMYGDYYDMLEFVR